MESEDVPEPDRQNFVCWHLDKQYCITYHTQIQGSSKLTGFEDVGCFLSYDKGSMDTPLSCPQLWP